MEEKQDFVIASDPLTEAMKAGFEWVVRDREGWLFCFKQKPYKKEDRWVTNEEDYKDWGKVDFSEKDSIPRVVIPPVFWDSPQLWNFELSKVKWEDTEPTRIEEIQVIKDVPLRREVLYRAVPDLRAQNKKEIEDTLRKLVKAEDGYGKAFFDKHFYDGLFVYGVVIDNGKFIVGDGQDVIGANGWRMWAPIRTETVGQYTGYKDKEGTKIFEGDIAEGEYVWGGGNVPEDVNGEVVFAEDGAWRVEGHLLGDITEQLTVTGSVHDKYTTNGKTIHEVWEELGSYNEIRE